MKMLKGYQQESMQFAPRTAEAAPRILVSGQASIGPPIYENIGSADAN